MAIIYENRVIDIDTYIFLHTVLCTYIYMYVSIDSQHITAMFKNQNNFFLLLNIDYLSSSLSSCHTASTDLLDLLSLPISNVHHSREVLQTTFCISTEQLYISSSWLSVWRCPQEYIAYEFIFTFPAVSHMSGLFNFDSFRDGLLVALQLLLCGGVDYS